MSALLGHSSVTVTESVYGHLTAADARAALGLAGHREHQLGGGAIWLHAAARRDLVRVRLTATVFAGVQEDK